MHCSSVTFFGRLNHTNRLCCGRTWGMLLGLYRDSGKEHGNHCIMLGYILGFCLPALVLKVVHAQRGWAQDNGLTYDRGQPPQQCLKTRRLSGMRLLKVKHEVPMPPPYALKWGPVLCHKCGVKPSRTPQKAPYMSEIPCAHVVRHMVRSTLSWLYLSLGGLRPETRNSKLSPESSCQSCLRT